MTRFLLDTQIVIWMHNEPHRLKPHIVNVLQDESSHLLLSIASLWEMSVKIGIGKLDLPLNFPAWLQLRGVSTLAVTPEHAWAVRLLPRLHGDPFDRMIVAQALAEGPTLVTSDEQMARYGCKVLAA